MYCHPLYSLQCNPGYQDDKQSTLLIRNRQSIVFCRNCACTVRKERSRRANTFILTFKARLVAPCSGALKNEAYRVQRKIFLRIILPRNQMLNHSPHPGFLSPNLCNPESWDHSTRRGSLDRTFGNWGKYLKKPNIQM